MLVSVLAEGSVCASYLDFAGLTIRYVRNRARSLDGDHVGRLPFHPSLPK
jgi:hypothetical protein